MVRKTKPVASRIDAESAARITRAAEELGVSKSAYLETVIETHIARNPNDLQAFEDRSTGEGEENAKSESNSGSAGLVQQILGDLA